MKTSNGSRSVAAAGMYALRQHGVYQISFESYAYSVAKILQKVIGILVQGLGWHNNLLWRLVNTNFLAAD